jgi:hypothetical protein
MPLLSTPRPRLAPETVIGFAVTGHQPRGGQPPRHAVEKRRRRGRRVRNRMPVSLRGGGGELGNLKNLAYGFTTFAQR